MGPVRAVRWENVSCWVCLPGPGPGPESQGRRLPVSRREPGASGDTAPGAAARTGGLLGARVAGLEPQAARDTAPRLAARRHVTVPAGGLLAAAGPRPESQDVGRLDLVTVWNAAPAELLGSEVSEPGLGASGRLKVLRSANRIAAAAAAAAHVLRVCEVKSVQCCSRS